MKLRSPAEYYLKYLVVHPDEYTNEQIEEICSSYGLDTLGDANLESLRLRCVPSPPFRPTDPLHTRSQRFLIKEGIRPLFLPDEWMKEALRILESPRAKEFAEAMILSHAPPLAIADALTTRWGVRVCVDGVERYKKMFWNIDLLDSTGMRALLHYRVQTAGKTGDNASASERAIHESMKKASYLDPRRLAADLPYSPITALMSQMRMGALPGNLELSKSIELVRAMAVLRTAEATFYGSPQDSSRALNFSLVAKNMTEMLEMVIKPDENLREQLNAIALRTEMEPIPSIHQLSRGQHTVELQPMQKQEVNEPPGTPSSEGNGTSNPTG